MKRDREVLEKRLFDICSHVALNSEICNKVYDFAKEKYNIPRGLTSDLICLRVSMSEATEFVLFGILDTLIQLTEKDMHLSDYYTKQEIEKYSKSKYKVDKIKFPLKLKMIQVSDDQWIGTIDVKMLMKFRAAQIINYNANAQRTMSRIIRGDKEIYKISLNQTAVNEISKCYTERTFIPNTITLNVPIENDDDFYYDENKYELIINKIESFQILDGYHRYIAACKASDADKDFNYEIELRIVNWDDAKSQTFIWQEDKKTPLKKIDRESLNMNKTSNIVVERLNNNINCNIKGLISRNQGLINYGELSGLIEFFFLKNISKKENGNKLIMSVVKYLCECFNALTEFDSKYIESKYSYKQLFIVVYMFYAYRNKSKDEMCSVIDNMIARKNELSDKKFQSKIPRKSMLNEIEKLYEVVVNDV